MVDIEECYNDTNIGECYNDTNIGDIITRNMNNEKYRILNKTKNIYVYKILTNTQMKLLRFQKKIFQNYFHW